MKQRVLILFALIKEADSFLNHSGLKFIKKAKNHFILENNDYVDVIITGMGKKNIVKINYEDEKDLMLVIKAGTCGVLDDSIGLKKILIPKIIRYNDRECKQDFMKLPMKLKKIIDPFIINKKILTVDKPLMSKKKSDELYKEGISLVEMELFFITEKLNNTTILPVLIGTDKGDKYAIVDFIKNLQNASNLLSDFLVKLIREL